MKDLITEVFNNMHLTDNVLLISIIPVSSTKEVISENKITNIPKVSTYDVTLQSNKRYLPNLIITEFDDEDNIKKSITNHVSKYA